jgi:exoribonuclease-2
VRAEVLPLVFRVPGTESLPRGARVRARVAGIDLLTLDLHAALSARLDAPVAAPADEEPAEDEVEAAGTLQIAITLDDAAEPAAAGAAATPEPAGEQPI